MQELAAETPEAELVEAHAQFAEHLWDQTMDVLQRAADGLASTKELVVFFRKRASAEQDLAMSMRKMCLVCAECAVATATILIYLLVELRSAWPDARSVTKTQSSYSSQRDQYLV